MICAEFSWNWPSGSGENFQMLSIYFCCFAIISLKKKASLGLLPEQSWIPFTHARIIGDMSGWNWPCGYEEKNENVKSLHTDGLTIGRQAISWMAHELPA